jgi:coenzyme F420-reducing hydrogenase alpha subunit
MIPQDEHNRKIYQSLKKAVAEAIERKRRLGQHVVMVVGGKPQLVKLGDESPSPTSTPKK